MCPLLPPVDEKQNQTKPICPALDDLDRIIYVFHTALAHIIGLLLTVLALVALYSPAQPVVSGVVVIVVRVRALVRVAGLVVATETGQHADAAQTDRLRGAGRLIGQRLG